MKPLLNGTGQGMISMDLLQSSCGAIEAASVLIFVKSSPKQLFKVFLVFFIAGGTKVPLPAVHPTGTICFSNKYFFGGPRFPNTSIVTRVPVLQHGHFLSRVFTLSSGRFIFSCVCSVCNLPRFHVLLRMP